MSSACLPSLSSTWSASLSSFSTLSTHLFLSSAIGFAQSAFYASSWVYWKRLKAHSLAAISSGCTDRTSTSFKTRRQIFLIFAYFFHCSSALGRSDKPSVCLHINRQRLFSTHYLYLSSASVCTLPISRLVKPSSFISLMRLKLSCLSYQACRLVGPSSSSFCACTLAYHALSFQVRK